MDPETVYETLRELFAHGKFHEEALDLLQNEIELEFATDSRARRLWSLAREATLEYRLPQLGRQGASNALVGYVRAAANGLRTETPKCLKSATLRVTTVSLWTCAVAAIMASSYSVSAARRIRRAHSRKTVASIDTTLKVADTCSSHSSSSSAFAGSCSLVIAMRPPWHPHDALSPGPSIALTALNPARTALNHAVGDPPCISEPRMKSARRLASTLVMLTFLSVAGSVQGQAPLAPGQVSGAELQSWYDADGFAAAGINLLNGCYFISRGGGAERAQSIHCATRPPFNVVGESRVVGNQICSKNTYPDGNTVAHCQDVFRVGENKYEMRVDGRPTTLMYRLVR